MRPSPYEIRVSQEPLQEVSSVSQFGYKYLRERGGDFYDSRLAAKLGSLAAGQLAVAPTDISRLSVEEGAQATLLRVPELEKTRHESRTAVQFGQLVLEGLQREPQAELVAVKYTRPSLAGRELSATREVQKRLGVAFAYEPIGFIGREETKEVGYISRYRHEVGTLDRVFWNEEATDAQRLAAAGRAGAWLGMLHASGLAHGDAEAKNIAHDNADNPVYPDLETMSEIPIDDGQAYKKQYDDLSDFIRFHDRRLSGDEFENFFETYADTFNDRLVSAAVIRELYEQPLNKVHHYGNRLP